MYYLNSILYNANILILIFNFHPPDPFCHKYNHVDGI